MVKSNTANERIKRAYFLYLEEAMRLTVATVDQVAAHIAAFEEATNYRDFKRFHIEQARKFKRDLREQVSARTGKPLALATINARLKALRSFFIWLAGQPGYRSRLKYSDAEYFNLTNNEGRIAKAERGRTPPTIDEIRKVLANMPARTEIERRDRALIAFTLVTGMRDDAIASLCLQHVDLRNRTVFQDARLVRTKNRKTFKSWFFPVGKDIEEIVVEWIRYLLEVKGLGPDQPVFPSTITRLASSGRFEPFGVGHEHWSNADPIRRIFGRAFQAAGLPYANPHSFRNTLTLFGEVVCKSPEEFKAWSQNLGHENVSTTFSAYGEVASHRQGEVMDHINKRLAGEGDEDPDVATVAAVISYLQKRASEKN